VIVVRKDNRNTVRRGCATKRYVELAVRENLPFEKQTDALEALALRLINRHREGDTYRELSPLEL
jgi:hypothetical protein